MTYGDDLPGAPQFMTSIASRSGEGGSRRLNRLPLVAVLLSLLLVLATIIFGLSARGPWRKGEEGAAIADHGPASSFAESLKRGVSDGIIGEPQPEAKTESQPQNQPQSQPQTLIEEQAKAAAANRPVVVAAPRLDDDGLWRQSARIEERGHD